MTTAIENPVVLVVDTPGVQDYVIQTPASVPPVVPKVWCSQRVIGVFLMFLGIAVGVGIGVLFGVYYKSC